MQKENNIEEKHNSWVVYLRLVRSAAPYWPLFVFGLIGTLMATGTDASLVWSVKPLLANWEDGNKAWWFAWLPLIIILVLAVRALSYFLSSYFLQCIGRNIVRDFRQRVFSHLMFLPASYYDKETSGKLLSTIIYNTEQVAVASTGALITVLQEGLLLVFLTVTMFLISWQLSISFLVTSPILFYIIRYVSKRLRGLSSNVQKSMGDLTQIASEGIENYKVVRVFGGEQYETDKFFKAAHKNRQREMKVVATSILGSALVQIITAIPIAVIIFIATQTSINVASLGAFVVAVLRLLTPLRRLTRINAEIQKGVAGAHSIFTILDQDLERDFGTKVIDRAKGKIEYRDVSFSYPGSEKEILRNISFTIEPGEQVALVGCSGGGKSTLVSLLPRFYDVVSGSILIDGLDVRDYKLLELRKQFALVSQHLTLFNDTIARNIAYGAFQDDIGEEEIMAAAKAAHILDFIKHLPLGLNTLIGENGLLLSGGQRQRIAIARALLKDAPILILDEATSALDTESERHIQSALEVLMKKRTTLVIAHRLSTIEHSDKILVVDEGRIIEAGTHSELLKLEGQYAKLYKMQFKDYCD